MLQHIRQHAWLQLLIASAACALLLGGSFVAAQDGGANTDDAEAAEQDAENATAGQQGVVRVARLIYGGGKTGACFAPGFLETVDRETDATVQRDFTPVETADSALFKHPFAIMTGDGEFSLSDEEIENLRDYLNRGGLLLASAGCSDQQWAVSFEQAMRKLFPDGKLEPIAADHPVFSMLFEIDAVVPIRGEGAGTLQGYSISDRLAVIYSPLGLNDTGNAGGGCCCCGGNEVRNAKLINANILVYALTN